MGLLCNPCGKRSHQQCSCTENHVQEETCSCRQTSCCCQPVTCSCPEQEPVTCNCTCTCTQAHTESNCQPASCCCQPVTCSCPEQEPVTCNCTCTCTKAHTESNCQPASCCCRQEVEEPITCTCQCTCQHNKPSCDQSCCCQDHQVNPGPMPIRAMLNYVIDSCCTTEDICKEITVDIPSIFDPDELCVGQTVNVDLAGDIMFKEVSRCKDDCTCLSTVRFAIPVRIFGNTGHGCGCKFIDRDICVVRSAKLCCAGDSQLTTFNSQVLAISAVISAIECDQVTICLCILFRSCLQQIILREFTWEATPVCVWDNCNDSRKHLFDSCDLLCGCTETGGKTCPSCG